jgi:hypothetical protein
VVPYRLLNRSFYKFISQRLVGACCLSVPQEKAAAMRVIF